MPRFQARQYPRVLAADVIREEFLARVVKRSHRKDRVALIENRLCYVGGALSYEQASQAVFGPPGETHSLDQSRRARNL